MKHVIIMPRITYDEFVNQYWVILSSLGAFNISQVGHEIHFSITERDEPKIYRRLSRNKDIVYFDIRSAEELG